MNPPFQPLPPLVPNRRQKVSALVFTCSGAADVGELTDLAARQLSRRGIAAMSCLASIGARDEDITFNAMLADQILLIDGCPKVCARRTFEQAGVQRAWLHFELSEIGLRKSRSPNTPENVQKVVNKATEVLAAAQKK
jgi:uncharacterized metal-binding protein